MSQAWVGEPFDPELGHGQRHLVQFLHHVGQFLIGLLVPLQDVAHRFERPVGGGHTTTPLMRFIGMRHAVSGHSR